MSMPPGKIFALRLNFRGTFEVLTIAIISALQLFFCNWMQVSTNLPYSGLFSRGKIFTNFANWPQFANIFPLKLYRCMVIY